MKTVENSDFIIKSTIFILLASIVISIVVFLTVGSTNLLDVNVADSYPNQVVTGMQTQYDLNSSSNVQIKFASDRTDVKALYYYIDFGNAVIENVSPLSNQTELDYIVVGTGISGGVPCSSEKVNVSFSLGTFPFDKPYKDSLLCIQASTLNSSSFFENGGIIMDVELSFPETGLSGVTIYSASRYVNSSGQNISIVTADSPVASYQVISDTPLVCGNGIVEANEVCDDSNTVDGDQCSNDCSVKCEINEFYNGTKCVNPSTNHTFNGNSFTIQNEDFNFGNNFIVGGDNSNATYYDKNRGYVGNHFAKTDPFFLYRNTEVDITRITNTVNDFAIGYSETGEWLEYTVNIPTAGEYEFYLNAQAPTGENDNRLKLDLDGNSLVDGFSFTPNVDQWNTPKNGVIFSEQMIKTVTLPQGEHTFRLTILQEFIDLNHMRFEYIENVEEFLTCYRCTTSLVDGNNCEEQSFASACPAGWSENSNCADSNGGSCPVEQVNEDIEIACGGLDTNGDEMITIIDFNKFIEKYNQFLAVNGNRGVVCIDSTFSTNNACGATDFNNDGKLDKRDYRNLSKKYSSDGSKDCSGN